AAALESERDRARLARAELREAPRRKRRRRGAYPALAKRRLELAGAEAFAASRDLVEHGARDQQRAVKPAQQLELAGGGEADQRARVRDDGDFAHDGVNLRRSSRRAPRTARSGSRLRRAGPRAAPAPRRTDYARRRALRESSRRPPRSGASRARRAAAAPRWRAPGRRPARRDSAVPRGRPRPRGTPSGSRARTRRRPRAPAPPRSSRWRGGGRDRTTARSATGRTTTCFRPG